jgi:hypothetical protein
MFALGNAAVTTGYDDDSVIRDPQVLQCLEHTGPYVTPNP